MAELPLQSELVGAQTRAVLLVVVSGRGIKKESPGLACPGSGTASPQAWGPQATLLNAAEFTCPHSQHPENT